MMAAWPLPMTADGAERIAKAPWVAVLAKLTTPPLTGSIGLLAVTVTARLANGVPMGDVCGVLPGTDVIVKPWLSKAPMSTVPTRADPRWSVVGMPAPLVPASMAGLPGSRAMVCVGPP